MKFSFISIFFMSLISGCTTAKEIQCFNNSKELITGLYTKFPIGGKNIVENSDANILNTFFSNNLTNLLLKDKECSKKGSGVCNIDFSIMTHQQDIPNHNEYKILQTTNTVVTVKLAYPQYSVFLDYIVDDSTPCKKIKNIKYDDNTNLLKILSK